MSSQSNKHGLKKTRKDHSTEIAEDYVELIAELIETHGSCRVTELARRLGVSHVTASRTVGRLVSSGLAETSPHQPIRLTPRGKRMATTARARHELVFEFLKQLGVSEKTASSDAEGIEHHCSPETLNAMKRLIKTGSIRRPR